MVNHKKHISLILIAVLILTGLFSYPKTSYGLTTYQKVTYYRLDTGVTFLWKNSAGEWQYSRSPGSSSSYTYNGITIPENAENVSAVAYQKDAAYGEAGYFPFKAENGIDSDHIIWNTTTIASDKTSYDRKYNVYAVTPSSISCSYTKSTGAMALKYNVTFNAIGKTPYDVKAKLSWGESGKDEVVDLLGSPTEEELAAMDLMNPESENYNSNVEGYLYFMPAVIKYDLIEQVILTEGEFYPNIDVPDEANVGESYTATDKTEFYKPSEFAESKVYYSVDGGSKKEVEDWDGTKLGGSIEQSFDKACSVTYTIKVWNIYGVSKTNTDTIRIIDGSTDTREISGAADLTLPEFTYEGHTELAKDESTFTVDGVDYSATRAYAEDIASNSFKKDSAKVEINRVANSDIKAECTFPEKGTYNITLNVKPVNCDKLTDTESIEVRKTPYIIDSLSGFQKQNRKQILTATVATYPGKPLTDYSITLKDKVTGNSVTLTPDNLQENNSTIKTRSVTMTQDLEKGFAYITVEFLTKTPSYSSTGINPQDFYYQIDVEDSKGDTDMKSKTFAVSPDLPPTPAISLDSAFLRNEGTNIATIKAEDVTIAKDGDSVARTWYYGATTAPSGYTDVSTMDGYQKLSFGTDKIVGFNRVGVGKFTTKLFVKEVWTEPTLEEYVTDSDHLTGTATAFSDVLNVAPIVSLELLNGTEQEILLLANSDAEYQTLMNNKTALQQALLANKIDGQIIIKKLIGDTPSTVIGIKEQLSYQFPAPIWSSGVEEETGYSTLTTDSEKTYLTTWTWINNHPTVPITVHTYNPYSGEVWSYTTTRNEKFSFGNDDTGKYLYMIYENSNQTVLLDKRTGAVAGTINMALSDKVWLSDNLAFVVQNSNLYAIELNSLTKVLVAENVSAVSRVNGNLQYITKSTTGIVRNTLDMETLESKNQLLIDTSSGRASLDDYTAVCIDSTGKVVFIKTVGTGTDTFSGVRIYASDNSLSKENAVSISTDSDDKMSYFAPLDEQGVCNHALIWDKDTSTSPDSQYFTAVNLNTGATGSSSVKANAFFYGCSAMFETKGKSYYYFPGWYVTAGTDYWGPAYMLTFNGATTSVSTTGDGMIGAYDEVLKSSDRMIASLFGSGSTGIMQMKVSSFPKTLAQETAEIISRFTNKLTFIGGVNTTSDEIKATAEAPKPTMKITAAQNGYVSLYNQSLIEDKKYYYEYEIKPLTDGTESKLTGMTASTPTATSNESFLSDTYYVEKSYKEDFGDNNINSFFTIVSGAYGSEALGMFGAYRKANTKSAKLTFVVPAGKKAILSFDYVLNYYSQIWRSSIYIDGERFYEDLVTTNSVDFAGHYTHYKFLSEGAHTIECVMKIQGNPDWEKVLLDNLKVDIVSTTPKTLKTTSSVEKNDEWLTMSGSFQTPTSTISYGSQASSYWSGALGETSARTGVNGYRNYNLSVPAGYYARGWSYPTGTLYKEYEYTVNLGTNRYTMYSSSVWYYELDPGEKTFLGTLQAGDYTQSIKWASRYLNGYIPQFDLIFYPANTATATGDITFNDSFTEYYFPKQSSTGLTNLSMYLPKGEYLIRNLKIYYMEDGRKIYVQNEDCEELTDLSKWTLSTGISASIITPTEEKTDDEYVKVYKKGEKVLYNIFYSDYEDDPSKTGYWVYTHINWPPDTVHPDVGKVLTTPIDRFYLSGKYTVTHWEVDNTQRTGTVGDATPYNKESNKVTMTFYVDGEGKAPWITYIKTTPSTVECDDSYTIRVGVDDTEKDTLALETSVYLNGTLIKTDNKTGITADSYGNYPEQTITGLPKAVKGTYQVICTVSDYSGTGIKSYKFKVEGMSADATVDATTSYKIRIWNMGYCKDCYRKLYGIKSCCYFALR